MKKLLRILPVILLLGALLTVPAFAAGDYATSGTYGDGITWVYDEGTKTLTISGTGDMQDMQEAPWEKTFGPEIRHAVIEEGITHVAKYAFYECSALETVSIPEGVTSIGGLAFSRCKALQEVQLPETLETMGAQLFNECNSLTEIRIPASVSEMVRVESQFSTCPNLQGIWVDPNNRYYTSDGYGVLFNKEMMSLLAMPRGFSGAYTVPDGVHVIGQNAMSGCKGLTELTLLLGVTSLQDYALAGTGLTEIVLPKSVNVVKPNAFYRCEKLERVELSTRISALGKVFAECTALREITLHEGLETLAKGTFTDCTALETITLPASLTRLDEDVFDGCTALQRIDVADGSSTFSSIDGVLYNKTKTILLEYPCGRQGAYAVPAGVREFGTAFRGSVGLTHVALPTGARLIEEQAFQGCSALEYIEVPAGVVRIGDGAFRDCSALEDIYIPDTVEAIGRNAFENCSALKSVYLPDSVTEVGWTCFWNCTALEEIRISPNIITIPNTLLRGCTALKEVVIPCGAMTMESAVFYECSALERIYLPDTLTFIDCKQTIGCTSLTDVYFTGSKEALWDLYTEPENDILFHATAHANAEMPAEMPAPTPKPVTVPTPAPTVKPTPAPTPAPAESPFEDVAADAWYAKPVIWAKEAGVTGGKTATTFAPEESCTRAQVVTFLWAANGKPEPTSMDNPFTDVASDAWYVKPVLWAVENGITGGTSATTFGPDQTCTRAQIATFLYASQGKPPVSGGSTFEDVANDAWYAKPVIWAKENEVTGGISPTQFGPDNVCTRAQVVTFLYKVFG